MDVSDLEQHFVFCSILFCLTKAFYAYTYLVNNEICNINGLSKINKNVQQLTRFTRHLSNIFQLLMCFLALVIFVMYLNILLHYVCQYLPLSTMYLVWKFDDFKYI